MFVYGPGVNIIL